MAKPQKGVTQLRRRERESTARGTCPHLSRPHDGGLESPTMASSATLGTTILRPRRMVGNSPRAASSYANARDTPSRRPASATDTTSRSPDSKADALVIAALTPPCDASRTGLHVSSFCRTVAFAYSFARAADVDEASRDCRSDRIWWIVGGFMSTTMKDARNETPHGNLHDARKSKKSAVSADAPILATRFLHGRKDPDQRVHNGDHKPFMVWPRFHRLSDLRRSDRRNPIGRRSQHRLQVGALPPRLLSHRRRP
jgi:hypothetical protein